MPLEKAALFFIDSEAKVSILFIFNLYMCVRLLGHRDDFEG